MNPTDTYCAACGDPIPPFPFQCDCRDRKLEDRIKAEYDALISNTDIEVATRHMAAMVDLIKQRSPAQIRRMEIAQGLAGIKGVSK